MSGKPYDAIVVGARCAGSPTALLLARAGYRVLLVDRATFPSDTVSTHLIHPPGVAALQRWGLLERLDATGCPRIPTYAFDFGPFAISGSPRSTAGVAHALCPRRTVLDKLLVDAAAEAGAEVREGFVAEELLFGDGRVTGIRGRSRKNGTVTEQARVVIGADGRNSFVAKSVQAGPYNERPALAGAYYTYFGGLPTNGYEVFIRPDRACALNPTHDGLTMLVVGRPYADFQASRGDIEGSFMSSLELIGPIAERVRAAERQERFAGLAVSSFFRQPHGPGWALVGDAGYTKDPVTAFGISDAFCDAERCVAALDEWFSGSRPFEEAMADYQQTRDEHAFPFYELTCDFASFQPPPPETQRLLAATSANREAMDAFVSMMAGTLAVPEFFAPAHVERILAAASEPVGG